MRIAAIRREGEAVDRFVFTSPPSLTRILANDYRDSLASYGRPQPWELRDAKPYVLRVVPARPGESVSAYAGRLPFDERREERFRVINGLAPGQALRSGQLVKVITAR